MKNTGTLKTDELLRQVVAALIKTYKDYPHGTITTQADVISADLLAFINS
jgi:hypothetical protein